LLTATPGVLLSNNLFAYCINSPVGQSDRSGYIAPAVIAAFGMYCTMLASSPDAQIDMQLMSLSISQKDYLGAALNAIGFLIPGATGMGMASKPLKAFCKKISLLKLRKVKILNRGHTGRYIANSLKEKLAMDQVMSNPLLEAKKLSIKMTDPKWRAEDGWVKMANNVNGVEIHFVYNKRLNAYDDFKFK
jgi:hypothetical protein